MPLGHSGTENSLNKERTMGTLFDIKDIKSTLPQIPDAKKEGKAEKDPVEKKTETAPEPEEPMPPVAEAVVEAGDSEDAEEDEKASESDEEEETEEPEEKKEEDPAPVSEKPAPKRYEKKEAPRDPYEWGKCPVSLIVQILKQDGNPKGQLVRVGAHTHDNPTEPPKIKSFRIANLTHPLPESFWSEVAKTINEMVETIVKEFPDRDAAWKANKEHKQDPEPYIHKKAEARAKAAGKKSDKPKPPSISNTTISMFKQETTEKKGASNA
jgi:hypothetical protein